ERNIISGNSDRGIVLMGANVAAGNWIGLDVNGAVLGNKYGIQVTETGSRIGTNDDGIADADERNVIGGNTLDGIVVRDATTAGAVIAGNYIGTDPTGTLARPNQGSGVSIVLGAHDNTVSRNVISGNRSMGVFID